MKENSYYICTDDNRVFKMLPTHYLQISPWNDGEDRRVYEMENDNYHLITYENACMIVNKQFQEIDERWERNNKKYIARKNSVSDDEKAAIISMLPSHKVQKQMSTALTQLDDGQQLSIQNETMELKMILDNIQFL